MRTYRGACLTAVALASCLGGAGAHADGQLECTSQGYRYNYCRVDTGGIVRLAHRQSKASCELGRSWGYDPRGIWVDNGCSAIFEYDYRGYSDRHDRHHKDHTGDIVAGAAALAILGAIVSSDESNRHQDHRDYARERVPGWAVGGFSGSDRESGTDISINVDGGGHVAGYYGHSPLDGQIDGDHAWLGSRGYGLRETRDGFQLHADDDRTVIDFYRD